MLSPLPAIAYAASFLTTHLSPQSYARSTIIPYGTSILLKRLTTSAHTQPRAPTLEARNHKGFRLDEKTCRTFVDEKLSMAANVLSPLSSKGQQAIEHYLSSSTQYPTCVVQPACPEDLAEILKWVAEHDIPFAVKSGGHAGNAGFSSTSGLHISMDNFDQIHIAPDNESVEIGVSSDTWLPTGWPQRPRAHIELPVIQPGQYWERVYKALAPLNRTVLGGRVPGVGVGGFIAGGGGYSWMSNQYGLAVDSVLQYTLVLPNATVINVTDCSDPKLFGALKGTINNFGIITSIKMKTFPLSPQVYGGMYHFSFDKMDAVSKAVASFSTESDNKAAILPSYTSILGSLSMNLQVFYDAPSPMAVPSTPSFASNALASCTASSKETCTNDDPVSLDHSHPFTPSTEVNVFQEFLDALPSANSVKKRSYLDFLDTTPANDVTGLRGLFHTIPTRRYSEKFLKQAVNQTQFWGKEALLHSGVLVAVTPEPFTPNTFKHTNGHEAYPHGPSNDCFPTAINLEWLFASQDAYWHNVAKEIHDMLYQASIEDGQDLEECPYYPNYALKDTPVEKLYLGKTQELREYRKQLDPKNVMRLTGGFRL